MCTKSITVMDYDGTRHIALVPKDIPFDKAWSRVQDILSNRHKTNRSCKFNIRGRNKSRIHFGT